MTYVPFWDEYDIANTTPEFRARWDAVAAKLPNFDGSLIEESLEKGWTVEETIAQGCEDLDERDEAARAHDGDWEGNLDRDISMNA